MTDPLSADALKAEIDRGLADLVEGRVQDFDVARIVERGRKLFASRAFQTLQDAGKKT